MTGIERLRDIAEDRYSGGMVHISVHKLREICDQIEAEAGVETVKSEAMEALAFVEEKGGLDELERRLMPEGMVWPRFEDGELVGFGDEYVNAKGNVSTLRTIVIKDCRDRLGGGYYWKLGKGDCAVMVKNGERIKRPPVRAADGKPLEAGQTVWDKNGDELIVGAIEDGGHTVACRYVDVGDGIPVHGMWSPSDLTHQRPVLDANGVPINEGDTVWSIAGEGPFTVKSVNPDDDPDSHEDLVWCGELIFDNVPKHRIADQLTHTKPEPDTWERIEHDALVIDETIESEWGGVCTDARDIVRRAKALAERGE